MNISENEISRIVYESGYKVHKTLGPGLLESAYEECMFYELKRHNLLVEKQKPMPLIYDEVKLNPQKINVTITDTADRNICRFFIAVSGERSR